MYKRRDTEVVKRRHPTEKQRDALSTPARLRKGFWEQNKNINFVHFLEWTPLVSAIVWVLPLSCGRLTANIIVRNTTVHHCMKIEALWHKPWPPPPPSKHISSSFRKHSMRFQSSNQYHHWWCPSIPQNSTNRAQLLGVCMGFANGFDWNMKMRCFGLVRLLLR